MTCATPDRKPRRSRRNCMNDPSPRRTQRASDAPDPFPGHDGGRWAPVPAQVVASWPAGSFAENLVIDSNGVVFVSLHSHNRVERYDPQSCKVETFAKLPAPATGLALGAGGTLWVTG